MIFKSLQEIARDKECFDPLHIIAWSDQSVSWADVCVRVDVYIEILKDSDSDWVVINKTDRVEFVAATVATWRLQKRVIFPLNLLATTRTSLSKFRPYWLLDEEHIAANHAQQHGPFEYPLSDFQDDTVALLFTSGSTGEPQAVAKSFAQFDHEIESLSSLMRTELEPCLNVSMVSHLHMYGLMFGVLLPLCRGLAFFANTVEYWESLELSPQGLAITLITSPTHLENIPQGRLIAVMSQIKRMYSAGARLEPSVVERNRKFYTGELIEIYGSTEVGAVAYRANAEGCWTLISGMQIRINQDGTLSARQIASQPTKRDSAVPDGLIWQNMKDFANPKNGTQFELMGRADNIVKLAGKRISLTAIERCLNSCNLVHQARVILLQGSKQRIGAVVELSRLGKAMLIDRGRRSMAESLQECLKETVERVAYPRYWRYVAALPRDAQGKVTHSLLESFFAKHKPTHPQILTEFQEGVRCQLGLLVQHNLSYFDGHFEGSPILPGVAQISWISLFATKYFGCSDNVCRMEKIKFMRVIQPGARVQLDLTFNQDSSNVSFTFLSKSGTYSSGTLHFC